MRTASFSIVAMALLFAAPAARAIGVPEMASMTTRAAAHDARVTGGVITWRSVFVLQGALAQQGVPVRLELARPIVATIDAEASPGVTAIRGVDGDAIVALTIDPERLPRWIDAVTVTLHETWSPRDDGLAPPLARGDATQRVVVTGDDDLRFEPREPAIERHVGYDAPPLSRESDRRACDDLLASRDPLPLDTIPIFVTGVDGVHGIHGHFSTAAERSGAGVVTATILFVVLALLLALAHRRLAGRARIEQAEAVLREEYGGDWRNG